MKHNRIWVFVLLAVFFVSVCGRTDGFSSVRAEAQTMPDEIVTRSEALALTPDNASLFLPESYEQYLPLENPSDFTVCENYLAVAEGQKIYIYDFKTADASYIKFTHSAQISKIQFSESGRLFFSDSLLHFYELFFSDREPKASSQLTSLSTFLINEDKLFTASVTTDSTTYQLSTLSEPNNGVVFGSNQFHNTPQLTFSNGVFYSIVEELVTVYHFEEETALYRPDESFSLAPNLIGLKSACAIGDILFYSVDGSSSVPNGLYCCDLSTQTQTLLFEGDGYGALTSYGGKLYAVKGNGVIEYEMEEGLRPTGYEIASASDSVKRLSGAQDIARARSLLVTADSGNNRLSVYDMEKDA